MMSSERAGLAVTDWLFGGRSSSSRIPYLGGPSAVQILAGLQVERTIIQDFCPLPESIEWQLGQRYFRERGNKAFISDSVPVPFVINNDGNLSARAAEVFFASLVAADAAGGLEADIFVLELGIGVGLFARYFLDAFARLCERHDRDYYDRLVYVAGDLSAAMLLRCRPARDLRRSCRTLPAAGGRCTLPRAHPGPGSHLWRSGGPAIPSRVPQLSPRLLAGDGPEGRWRAPSTLRAHLPGSRRGPGGIQRGGRGAACLACGFFGSRGPAGAHGGLQSPGLGVRLPSGRSGARAAWRLRRTIGSSRRWPTNPAQLRGHPVPGARCLECFANRASS